MHFCIICYFCDLSNLDELMMNDLSILILLYYVVCWIKQQLKFVSLTKSACISKNKRAVCCYGFYISHKKKKKQMKRISNEFIVDIIKDYGVVYSTVDNHIVISLFLGSIFFMTDKRKEIVILVHFGYYKC